MGNQTKMPTLFIGHGSPMNAIEKNQFTDQLVEIGKGLPKPSAILMVSAHWQTRGSWLTAMDKPRTIHDFFGFPQKLFDQQYPAPGSPHLAQKISNEVDEPEIGMDNQWGLDHGTWAVLKHIFPDADVPVVQLSLDATQPIAYHFELAKKLQFLREQGVLIMGSGNIVHNLQRIQWDEKAPAYDWTLEFDEWVKSKLINRDYQSLIDEPLKSSAGKLSVPTWEHYLPMLYTIGASDSKDELQFDYEGIQNASVSMRSFRLT